MSSMPRSRPIHRPWPVPPSTLLSALLCVLILLTPATRAQPPDSEAAPSQPVPELPAELFSEQLRVRVISVDVHVSDRRGRWIGDLTEEDFELRVDGQQVPIEYFALVEGGEPEAGGTAADGGGENDGDGPVPVAAPPVYQVILLDNDNMRPGSRKRAMRALEAHVGENLGAEDRVMIVSHDNAALNLRRDFTGDREELATGLAAAAELPTWGINQDSDYRLTLEAIKNIYEVYLAAGQDPCTDGIPNMEEQIRAFARGTEIRTLSTLRSLSFLVGAVGGLPGRKALYYFGDGLAQRSGLDLFHLLSELCPQSQTQISQNFLRYDISPQVRELTARANANRVTLYTFETRGIAPPSVSSLEFADRRFTPSSTNDSLRTANTQSPLFAMAEDTGGTAALNANRLEEPLTAARGDFRNYYSLGFTVRGTGDGGIHNVGVKVEGRGLTVRHRLTFRDKPEAEVLAERTLAALFFGAEENPLALTVEPQDPDPASGQGAEPAGHPTGDGGQRTVRLRFALPRENLTLLPAPTTDGEGATLLGRIEVVMTTRNGEGQVQNLRRQTIPVALPVEGDQAATFEVGLDLAPGRHQVAAAVRDLISGVTSVLRREVAVGETEPTAESSTLPPGR